METVLCKQMFFADFLGCWFKRSLVVDTFEPKWSHPYLVRVVNLPLHVRTSHGYPDNTSSSKTSPLSLSPLQKAAELLEQGLNVFWSQLAQRSSPALPSTMSWLLAQQERY